MADYYDIIDIREFIRRVKSRIVELINFVVPSSTEELSSHATQTPSPTPTETPHVNGEVIANQVEQRINNSNGIRY